MTKSSKEQKKPLNNKLLDPSHDETLGEGVSAAQGIFKPKFLKYALLILLVGCGLIYVAPNLNFDFRSNLNKFEAFWYNVSNLKFWKDPIAQLYGANSIPATFIIDEEGNLIDKQLRSKQLYQKIKELLD